MKIKTAFRGDKALVDQKVLILAPPPMKLHSNLQVQLDRVCSLLVHDFQSGTAHVVPQLLAELKSGGYKIVHLRSRAEIRTLPQYDEELQKNQRLPTVSQRPTSNVVRDIQ
jgi:hypothetical protein